jgi:hypothetical protein
LLIGRVVHPDILIDTLASIGEKPMISSARS